MHPNGTLKEQLAADSAKAGGPVRQRPDEAGCVGKTLFDVPGSSDLAVTVVVSNAHLQDAPSQSLVRIKSRVDGRSYLGVVTAGPFAEPDGLRGDSSLLTAVATHGGDYLPPFHGRVEVTLLGEELAGGALVPPRLRPLPNSPVFVLTDEESGKVLKCGGDVRLGLAVGHEGVEVGAPSAVKHVLPRHTAILGTTGGGKSNTVAGLVKRAADAGMAVIVLDVEGEYTHLHEPTDQPKMRSALRERKLEPAGLKQMGLFHLVGRDTTNPDHPDAKEFSLQFARLSPYAVMEMIGANDAQEERFLFAYDLAKQFIRELGWFPEKDVSDEEKDKQERILQRLDEFERGHPRMTLSLLLDVVGLCKAAVAKTPFTPFNAALKSDDGKSLIKRLIPDAKQLPGVASSWGKLLSLLWRLNRLKVFDRHGKDVQFMKYAELLRPGRVSVIDLSDAGLTELTNLAIADMLRGVQEAQEANYRRFEKAKQAGDPAPPLPRVLIVVEEAHEFLSDERIGEMPVLFQQVEKIAKRGRKRWLGLCFVTQLPTHLPKQVLGLCNSFVLHKLNDPQVVSTLKKTVAGIDDGLWDRLPGLAPGQAIASFPHFTRPLLVSVDPAPGKLRLVD